MISMQDLRQAKEELKTWAMRALAQTFVYTLTSKASAIGDADAVESADDGRDPDATDAEKKGQRAVVRIQPFGFRSVQPKGIRGLALRLGVSNLFFIGIGPSKGYGPQSLDVGECSVYAQPGQTFVLDKNGNLIATPAGSGTVQLGGTNYKMILDTLLADLKTALGYIPTAASTTYPGVVPNVLQWTAFLTKLGDGTYQSMKVQNG